MDAQNSTSHDAIESELKFALTAEAVEKIRSCPILRAQHGHSEPLLSIYFDTPRCLLGKSGLSLRVRQSGNDIVQTLKHESQAATGLFVRPEYETTVSNMSPDLNHLRLHCPVKLPTRTNLKLNAIFSVDVRRTNWPIHWKDSDVNISIDEGAIRAGERHMPIRELEIELRRGDIGTVFDLAKQFAAIAPLRLETASKAERGYRLLRHEANNYWKPPPVVLQYDATLFDVFRAISLYCLNHFSANEALFLVSPSAENIHQMRVALRRFLSLLSLCKPVLRREQKAQIRVKIRRIFRKLGKARDLDVAIETFNLAKNHGSPIVFADLNRKRETAYRRIWSMLQSHRLSRDMIEILDLIATGLENLSSPGAQNSLAIRPLLALVSGILEQQWEKLREFDSVSRLGKRKRHRLRIRTKRFRYACDFFESLYSAPKQIRQRHRFVTHLEDIQDCLGRLNDLTSLNHLTSKAGDTDYIPKRKRSYRHFIQDAAAAQDALLKERPFWH